MPQTLVIVRERERRVPHRLQAELQARGGLLKELLEVERARKRMGQMIAAGVQAWKRSEVPVVVLVIRLLATTYLGQEAHQVVGVQRFISHQHITYVLALVGMHQHYICTYASAHYICTRL